MKKVFVYCECVCVCEFTHMTFVKNDDMGLLAPHCLYLMFLYLPSHIPLFTAANKVLMHFKTYWFIGFILRLTTNCCHVKISNVEAL